LELRGRYGQPGDPILSGHHPGPDPDSPGVRTSGDVGHLHRHFPVLHRQWVQQRPDPQDGLFPKRLFHDFLFQHFGSFSLLRNPLLDLLRHRFFLQGTSTETSHPGSRLEPGPQLLLGDPEGDTDQRDQLQAPGPGFHHRFTWLRRGGNMGGCCRPRRVEPGDSDRVSGFFVLFLSLDLGPVAAGVDL